MDQPTVNIPEEVLSSLCTRFLINIPDEERNDLIRVFFQIELAHWFYIDFFRVEHRGLPNCGIKEFSKAIFKHCPFLIDHADQVDRIYAEWKEYKISVPTYGGILLDESLTHLLMVQGFFSRTSWGFPKGKVNKEEQPVQCAAREVREETGFDITPLIDENNFIETSINDQLARLYIVPNVPMNVEFKPLTRGEIREVRWFMINDLPASKKDPAPKVNLGLNPNNFFMVIPFIKPLKKRLAKMQAGAPNRGYSPSPLIVFTSNHPNQSQRTQSPTSQQGNYRPNASKGRGGNSGNANTVGSTNQTTDNSKSETRRRQQQQNFKMQNMNAIGQYSRFKDPAIEALWNQGGAGGKRQKGYGGGSNSPSQEGQRHSRHSKTRVSETDSNRQNQDPHQESSPAPSRQSNRKQAQESRRATQPVSCSKSFLTFKFDVDAIMRAFDGVK